MRKLNCVTAIREAMFEEMKRDSSVILLGEDVRLGVFGTSVGLFEEFGEDRVFDTPLSEGGFVGTGIGAAMVGMRPIVDVAMGSFMYVGMDQFVSMAAKTTYTYGGQFSVPLLVRAGMVYNVNNAAQHSDRPYPMFMNVPGLKIVAPSNALDMYGLIKSAVRDNDPVLCFEDRTLPGVRVDIPDAEEDFTVPLGKGKIVKEGGDVTIVGIAGCMVKALEAAELLADEGIDAEVVDPRTLVPLDKALILESVKKTGRAVIVDPAHKTCSAASEISSIIVQETFSSLRGPIQVVATADVPIPFSKTLESQLYPTTEKIINAVKRAIEN
jgi:pyruvate dehydrogenase E1 component beta subunit